MNSVAVFAQIPSDGREEYNWEKEDGNSVEHSSLMVLRLAFHYK